MFSIAAFIVVGLLIYSNALNAPFQFDDLGYIVNNQSIRDIGDISAIWNALGFPTRFVSFYSFSLNYHFAQLDPYSYHLTNIIIHILNGILVYWLVLIIFSAPALKESKILNDKVQFALLSALLFLVHPIQTQAVTYIVQRFASLATFFYLVSVCFYLKGRLARSSALFFCVAFLSAILGMLTKEIVFTLPLVILLIEWIFFPKKSYESNKLYIFVLIGLLLIIPLLIQFDLDHVFAPRPSHSHDGDVITPGIYLMTQFCVLTKYIGLILWPASLNLDYDFQTSLNLLDYPTSICFLFVLMVILLAIKVKSKKKLLSFGLLWFFITLAVESSFIPIRHVIFEHRLYLPMVGVGIILVKLLFDFFPDRKRRMMVASIVLITFSILTYQRNNVWKTEEGLWLDVTKKSPNKARGFNQLGLVYLNRGDYDKALTQFEESLKRNPEYPLALVNKGHVLLQTGQYDQAEEYFNQALSVLPTDVKAYSNRGVIHLIRGNYELALADFNAAMKHAGESAEVAFNRSSVYIQMGQENLALADLNDAVRLKGDYIEAYNNRGNLHRSMEHFDLALADFNKAIELNPRVGVLYFNRAKVYRDQKDFTNALKDASRAIHLGYTQANQLMDELKKLK